MCGGGNVTLVFSCFLFLLIPILAEFFPELNNSTQAPNTFNMATAASLGMFRPLSPHLDGACWWPAQTRYPSLGDPGLVERHALEWVQTVYPSQHLHTSPTHTAGGGPWYQWVVGFAAHAAVVPRELLVPPTPTSWVLGETPTVQAHTSLGRSVPRTQRQHRPEDASQFLSPLVETQAQPPGTPIWREGSGQWSIPKAGCSRSICLR